jgi:heme A synthase
MPSRTLSSVDVEPTTRDSRERRRLGSLSLFAALYTYSLILFGGIVRITGSGMGCGPDWPRCNGRWIPPFTLETLIEYTHRLLAAGISVVVLAVFVYAFVHRARPGFSGRSGLLRPLMLGAALLIVQILLGAITVRLDLPTSVTVVHFITATLFMATLIVTAARAGAFGDASLRAARGSAAAKSAANMALAAAVLGLLVISFGAVTANMVGAPLACQGFPLCNGNLLPAADVPPMHAHWGHRLLAFLLLLHVAGAVLTARRRGASSAVTRAATATLLLVLTQIGVAAALVLLYLPKQLQALHLAVGVALWFSLVVWVALARRDVLHGGAASA